MSRWRGNEDQCPHCGLKYKKLETGHTYQEVRMMLWLDDPDCTHWKYKRRNTVLGLWHQIKQSMWREHLLQCEHYAMWKEAEDKFEGEFEELMDIVRKEEHSPDDLSDIPF